MRPMPRWLQPVELGLLVAGLMLACSGKNPGALSELVLSIQTDMSVPKDVNQVGVRVLAHGVPVLDRVYDVGPSGVRVPATLGIVGGKDASTPVRIVVWALQNNRVRTLREVITTVPHERVALLRMPIEWLCDEQVLQTGQGLASTCGDGMTCAAGKCVSAQVDASTLPDYAPGLVFGGGDQNGGGSCFDTVACFAEGASVDVDPQDCSCALPSAGAGVNVGLAIPPGGDGICGEKSCVIPLNRSATDGWHEEGGRIRMPAAVCERLSGGKIAAVYVTTACATKTEATPTCGPWSSVGAGGADGGAQDGGGGEAGPDGGGGCDFPPAGSSGPVSVAPSGAPASVDEQNGTSQDQMVTGLRQLPATHAGVLRRGPCGAVGLVYRVPDPEGVNPAQLTYADVTGESVAPEVVEPSALGVTPSFALLFDDACTPLVVRASLPDGYTQYTRVTASQWQKGVVTADLGALLGATPEGLSHMAAHTTSDGRLHVLAVAAAAGASVVLHGHREAAAGAAWTFETRAFPPGKEVSELRMDATGTLHALFTKTEFPCDPCNLDLYYGRLPSGGTWTTETVQPSTWGPPEDLFSTAPSLAIDAANEPVVAASYQRRAVTGSLMSSELRVYRRNGGAWCGETVATQSDGYAGDDGTQFTGATPHLEIDQVGRYHVVFGDIAQWHDGQGYANDVQGQVRYAVRAGSEWQVFTLLEQAGKLESPQPLQCFDTPILAASGDGTSVHVAGVERVWNTNSIYVAEPVPVTLRATVIRTGVTLP